MHNNRKATSEMYLPHYGLDGVVGHSLVRFHQARQFGITHGTRTPILVHTDPEILKKLKIRSKISLICTRDSMQKILSMNTILL
jgi:hypothetical protein